jgi:DNA-binding GntR family transcriptional regulator
MAVERIPGKKIEEVNEFFDSASQYLNKDHIKFFIKVDTELHRMIINNCGNKRLIKLINNYNKLYIYYRIADLSRIERAKNAYFEHLAIFEAVKNRDVKRAVELMDQHIEYAKEIIISKFNKYNNLQK